MKLLQFNESAPLCVTPYTQETPCVQREGESCMKNVRNLLANIIEYNYHKLIKKVYFKVSSTILYNDSD